MAIKDKDKIVHNLDDNFTIGDYSISFSTKRNDIKVVFMGTPIFSVPVLKKLIDGIPRISKAYQLYSIRFRAVRQGRILPFSTFFSINPLA